MPACLLLSHHCPSTRELLDLHVQSCQPIFHSVARYDVALTIGRNVCPQHIANHIACDAVVVAHVEEVEAASLVVEDLMLDQGVQGPPDACNIPSVVDQCAPPPGVSMEVVVGVVGRVCPAAGTHCISRIEVREADDVA
eukprot:714372-Lingulodinium_polyedra.AAC.1